ncbi:hypothetical protein [Flavobacterium sp. FlaQc-30]|uniref:hypothetical protein n=1 Tax=Flavobacterium sp. FlaQc-30 TaxID=3374179 RepID=UPI003757B16C
MDESIDFYNKVLKIFTRDYTRSYTLEELTKSIIKFSDTHSSFRHDIDKEREMQAKVLDVLICLDSEGFVFLNSNNDESIITTKGLLKVGVIILCN